MREITRADLQIAFEKVNRYIALEKTTFNRQNCQAALTAINLMFDILTCAENEVMESYISYREIMRYE